MKKLLLILFLLSTPAWATNPAQQKTGSVTGTSLVITLDSNVTAGNSLVAFLGGADPLATSISGGGVTWVLVTPYGSTHYYGSIWYGLNSSGGVNSITITTTSVTMVANIVEFSGVVATAALEQRGHSAGTTGNALAPTLTLVAPHQLLLEMASTADGTVLAPTVAGYTALTGQSASGTQITPTYQVVTSNGSKAGQSWTIDNGDYWDTLSISLIMSNSAKKKVIIVE